MPRRKNLDIRVTIREKHGKQFLRYRDPITGEEQLKLAKGRHQSQWEREAGAWERELKEAASNKDAVKRAAIVAIQNFKWADFVKRLNDEHLSGLAESTDLRFQTVLNSIAGFEQPVVLTDIDASYLSRYQSHLREAGLAEATISSHLGHLKVALNWAKDIEILAEVPKFPKAKRARKGQRGKPMKGRPPTDKEFASILAAAPEAVPAESADRWRRIMKGMWWGSLRLEEALELHWDRLDKMRVDLDGGRYPVLRILSTSEKGKKDRTYPIAPEFAELLRETPIEQRTGLVFPLKIKMKTSADSQRSVGQVGVNYASQRITRMGELAGVVTHVDARTKQKHWAGAHDLRRAFGTRWARRVKPLLLKEMMRHESLETTMDYYVDLDADESAAEIWAAWAAAVQPNGASIAKPEYPTKFRLIWRLPAYWRNRKKNVSGDQSGD